MKYSIDDLFQSSIPEAIELPGLGSTPATGNTFSDGVGSALDNNEFLGNTTMQDGYFQSNNFVTGSTGWRLSPTGIEAQNGTFSGTITATTGEIGGFDIGSDYIRDAADSMGLASTVSGGDDVRFWAGDTFANRATADFRVTEAGAVTASSMTITGGSITTTPISGIPNNSSTDISLLDFTHDLVFSVTDKDTVAWATGTITMSNGRTFSIDAGNTGNMSARTYVYLDTGVSSTVLQTTTTVATAMGANKKLIAVAQNGSAEAQFQVNQGIMGMKLTAAMTSISNNDWTYSGAFTVTDADTVAWASGTLTTSNGGSYSITGSNTGNMVAKTYVYFDLGTSATAFQTTATSATAIGDGKILVAICQNGTDEATFMLLNDNSYNIDAANIVAGSITANEIAASTITANEIAALTITADEIAANTITAGKLSVSQLSAIVADLGTVTAGSITVVTGGNTVALTPGSATAFTSGPTGSPTVTITQAGVLTATGAVINGYTLNTKGTFGGDGSDGTLAITSGTTTISCGSAKVLTKNYSSISITGTGVLAFSNPHASGSMVLLKSQGNVTLTSSATPMLDFTSLGAAGGAGSTTATENPGTDALISFLNAGKGLANGTGGVLSTTFSNYFQNIIKYATTMAGAGGSGAGGQSGGTGGGGGYGAGVGIVECNGAWNFTTASGISVKGGDAVARSGDGGGGGGGGGGTFIALYNTLTASSGTIVTTGGTGGGGNSQGGGGGGCGASANGVTAVGNDGGDGGAGASLIALNENY